MAKNVSLYIAAGIWCLLGGVLVVDITIGVIIQLVELIPGVDIIPSDRFAALMDKGPVEQVFGYVSSIYAAVIMTVCLFGIGAFFLISGVQVFRGRLRATFGTVLGAILLGAPFGITAILLAVIGTSHIAAIALYIVAGLFVSSAVLGYIGDPARRDDDSIAFGNAAA